MNRIVVVDEESGVRHELPPSVALYVANQLEEQILSGRLLPGSPLLQLDLAAEFGVSRVPVRDALAMLEQRRLAVRVPRRGVIVRPITMRSVREVFAARRLLEAEIVRLAVPRIGRAGLDALDAIIARQRAATRARDLKALHAADHEFHATIWRACGSEVLQELIGTIWLRALQARSYGHRSPSWGVQSITRHQRIVAAMRRADVPAAITATIDAIDAAETEILAVLEANGEGDDSVPAAPPLPDPGAREHA